MGGPETDQANHPVAERQYGQLAKHLALPVVEVFGPTIQGEGPCAGRPAYFVRFGGCDFRCVWCDSGHAVEPAAVRQARRLSVSQILASLQQLPKGPRLVVLTGGNPALFELGELVGLLQTTEFEVAVETQGSIWRDWLINVNQLVVSPKPPSSGMVSPEHSRALERFLGRLQGRPPGSTALKIVIFDAHDLKFAEAQHARAPSLPLMLLAGTDVGLSEKETLARLRARFRWLCEMTARNPNLSRARVLPQLQVIAWGNVRGV
jgi:7-carboxy-7-deazaguanine synthase